MPARKRRLTFRRIVLLLALVCVVAGAVVALDLFLTLPDVTTLRARNPVPTSLMRLREVQARRRGRLPAVEQEWIAFDDIPPLLRRAVLAAEDANFYGHQGIDFGELREAINKNIREGKLVRGGSTITQQLAKNLYLSTEKTLWRKLKEALIARRLEKALPKNRILHLYLNVIELGPGIFGVRAAAKHWFGCDVTELSTEQIVRLVAIIPRPLRTDPRGRSTWLRWRARWIADTLWKVKAIDDETHAMLIAAF